MELIPLNIVEHNSPTHYSRPQPEAYTDEETIDLRHYWRVLVQNKLGIISLGFIAAVVAAFIMMGKDNFYRSTATLLIEANEANITTIEGLYGIDSQSREYFSTQFELLKNRNLAVLVIQELGLLQHQEFVPVTDSENSNGFNWRSLVPEFLSSNTNADVNDALVFNTEAVLLASVLNTFNNRLTIQPVQNTDLVRVSFEARDPNLAAEVVNSLARNFIESDLEQRLSATQQASVWLTGRLQGLKQSLGNSEQSLQTFLEQEELVDIKGVSSLNIQELDELTSQSIENRLVRSEAETLYRQIQGLQNPSVDELLAFPAVLNHPSMQVARQNAIDLDQQFAELTNRYGRNHPKMIALTAERATVKQNLNDQAKQVLSSLENNYFSALNNEQVTLGRLEQSKSDLQSINRKTFKLNELEREVEINRQLYDIFFTRIRETDETIGFQSTNAIVVDAAVPSIAPSSPNRRLVVMIALALGLMFGVMLAFLRDMLDNTIENHHDIEERLNTPVLGTVPLVTQAKSSGDTNQTYLGFAEDAHSPFSEALRTIRTSITLSSIDNPYKVIEVTSSVPNEGKSTMAINLSTVMAQMGKVLLIDTDMRRPSLHKCMGLGANFPGLSNFLAGSSAFEECIYSYEELHIDLIPAGLIVPNPLELLSSSKFKNLLTQLSAEYDHIILDSPPMKAVSDSLILSTLADALVYVVKAGSTTVNDISSELSRLKQANGNVIGVVLNQVDVKKQVGYGYGTYEGYYGAYG